MTTTIPSFKPYGKIINTKAEFEELEKINDESIRQLTEPEEIFDSMLFGQTIHPILPLEYIQISIKELLGNIKQYYNELIIQESIKAEEQELEFGISYIPLRQTVIVDLNIDEKNPFHWILEITHAPYERLEGMNDEYYEWLTKDNRLYLKLLVAVYHNKTENSSDSSSMPYFIFIKRINGRSHVYYDFVKLLKKKINAKERHYIMIFKERMPFLYLFEGTQKGIQYSSCKTELSIIKYLFDFGIMREVSSYLFDENYLFDEIEQEDNVWG
jgi:hypothetical protein